MSIWVIEQGEYSNYRVVGVFTSKENAQKVADWIAADYSWSTPTVAEWPLDPVVDKLNAGLHQYLVYMRRDGEVERVEQRVCTHRPLDVAPIWRRSTAPFYKGKDAPDVLDASVWAMDDAHAVKIVNERRVQMIANGAWK